MSSDCGVIVSLSPSTVAPKSNTPEITSIECSLSKDIKVNVFYAIKILRTSKRDKDFVTIAQVKPNKPPEIPASAPCDVKGRAKVSGGIDTQTVSSSKLKLKFNTKDLVCEDAGEYKCTAIFEDDNDILVTDEASATLEIDSMYCIFIINFLEKDN